MKKLMLSTMGLLVATMCFVGSSNADHIWINEFHYDNVGTDQNEFVEIAFRSGSTTTIGDYNLDFYNGNGGATYNTFDLANAVQGATSPVNGSPQTVTFFTIATAGIQNGNPDGLALSLKSSMGLVGTFLSYEGEMTATSGPASGITSTDIGVVEGATTSIEGSVSLVGMGDRANLFSWAVTDDQVNMIDVKTPGAANSGQLFVAGIPEPTSAVVLMLGLVGLATRRKRS